MNNAYSPIAKLIDTNGKKKKKEKKFGFVVIFFRRNSALFDKYHLQKPGQ